MDNPFKFAFPFKGILIILGIVLIIVVYILLSIKWDADLERMYDEVKKKHGIVRDKRIHRDQLQSVIGKPVKDKKD